MKDARRQKMNRVCKVLFAWIMLVAMTISSLGSMTAMGADTTENIEMGIITRDKDKLYQW